MGKKSTRGGRHEVQESKRKRDAVCGVCDLCGRDLRCGERYYRVSGENVCRGCLAEFAAQILAAYEVTGGEADG